jgi:pantoate--beta-alanine ligase
VHEVRARIAAWKKENLSIGLVPTMGYLHEGHQSLMERAVRENDRVVVSIFVNPLQFGPHEDLEEYPRDPDRDRRCCENAGVHLLFHPELQAMYPPAFHTSITVSELTTGLCGKSRPGHFSGVCTVVCKLFNIIGPNRAYFGQKDAQQLAVIRQMTQDLNIPTDIIACPIVREHDGLAKSSRNIYLVPEERAAALTLNRSLQLAAQAVADGERKSAALTALIKQAIAAQPLIRIDYIELVEPSSMQPVQQIDGPTLIALAAYVGKARLLDNLIVCPH